jgi:hypothetical protein
MNVIALFFGAMIGLVAWSRLTRLSYAVHDATSKVNLATKLSAPNSKTQAKLIWCVVAASFIWLVLFSAVCLHFAYADPSKHVLAWFFGGMATTPAFIAYTTARAPRRFKKRKVESA